ncbi:MAG: phosphatase [Zetaproteobacteria bacterium]|nr:phosphatase [Pseudobdellovibrionaceae bacterium]|tara:strand:- start:356 stop:1024 length:669 start_codon:yes stop_codon:yes gene_type:complete
MNTLELKKDIISEVLKFKYIIWDWNGTLLDDRELSYKTLIDQQKKHKITPITYDNYLDTFCFPIKDFYIKLGFDFSITPFVGLAKEFFNMYEKNFFETKLFPGVDKFLNLLSIEGKKQFVVSAAEESYLKKSLDHFKISHYFNEVCGLKNKLGESKKELAQNLLHKWGLPLSQTIFIGDTLHDLEVAKSLDIEAMLLADGHQSYKRLKDQHKLSFSSRFESC